MTQSDESGAHLMEIRGLSQSDAEQFVDDHGEEHCERLVQSRWE